MDSHSYREWVTEHLQIGKEILYLTQQDCIQTGLTAADIYQLVETSLMYHGRKEIDMPARIGIYPKRDSFIHAMPAHIPSEHISGMKWGSCFIQNSGGSRLSTISALLILNDQETGCPIAIMDGRWITAMRTPAVTMVGVKYLANGNAETYGMIGCGAQGKAHVRQITNHLPKLKRVHIYDSSQQAAKEFIDELQSDVDVEIIQSQSLQKLVTTSEVITSATAIVKEAEPQISHEWIEKGQTIFQCDLHSLFTNETVKRADKYIVDSIDQHDLLIEYGYYPQGLPEIYGEIGDIVAGIKYGRETTDELIINNNIGMAVEDIVLARAIFDRALHHVIGQKLPL